MKGGYKIRSPTGAMKSSLELLETTDTAAVKALQLKKLWAFDQTRCPSSHRRMRMTIPHGIDKNQKHEERHTIYLFSLFLFPLTSGFWPLLFWQLSGSSVGDYPPTFYDK